jgi:hypothetical protein
MSPPKYTPVDSKAILHKFLTLTVLKPVLGRLWSCEVSLSSVR